MLAYAQDLDQFLNSSVRNTWISYRDIQIYVRKGYHRLQENGPVLHTLDIANANVRESQRNKGIFTDWLSIAEIAAREFRLDAVYVESILNKRLEHFLADRGYQDQLGRNPPSRFLLL